MYRLCTLTYFIIPVQSRTTTVAPRRSPGYAGIFLSTVGPRISIIPQITPIVLSILKQPGSIMIVTVHQGVATDWPRIAKVSSRCHYIRFVTDAPRIDDPGDPASEPGQWEFTHLNCLYLTSNKCHARHQDIGLDFIVL